MPAPPPESDPAIESTRGGDGAWLAIGLRICGSASAHERPPLVSAKPGSLDVALRLETAEGGAGGSRADARAKGHAVRVVSRLHRREHLPQDRILWLGGRTSARSRLRFREAPPPPLQLVANVLDGRDHGGSVTKQPVGTRALAGGHPARDGSHRTADIPSELDGYERTRGIGRL